MILIKLNGRKVSVEPGAILLEVIRSAGIYVPSLCYLKGKGEPTHPCGLCVVKIEGEGIVRSCKYEIKREISVLTEDEELKGIRRRLLESMVANHYGDCKAPCHGPCPGGLNIQGYIGFIAKGDFRSALALIKERLPLPAVVGRVCPRFCEPICRRAIVDEAVAINNLKRFVADYCLEHGEIPLEVPPSNGKRVAIIGAGPAGLSCAYFLKLKGYEVTIFDQEKEPGGLLRYGIPTFKLPREIVAKEISSILALGIDFVGGRVWGRDFTLKDLRDAGFEAVFIAVGARREKFQGFPGEEKAWSGFRYLFDFSKGLAETEVFRGKRVAILGCSYTAVELSRVLRRLGAEVHVFHPRSRLEVSVPQREIGYAEREGVQFHFATMPLLLEESGQKYKLTLARTTLTEKREIKVVEESAFEEVFDIVFRAWGEVPDTSFREFGEIEAQLEVTGEGTIKVNPQTHQTSVPWVFAGGDFVHGSKTVIQAVASGRRSAQGISAYLEGRAIERAQITVKYDFTRGKRIEDIDVDFTSLFTPEKRASLEERDPGERIQDFEEALVGLTSDEAIREAKRCLRCGCLGIHKCEFREILIKEDVPVSKARKRLKYPINYDHPMIVVDSNKCIACERCVRSCPYSAIFFRVVDKGKPTEYITFRFTEACVNCGVCVDVCPTGALTKKDLLVPYQRDQAKAVKSVCPFCGVGCNLTVWVKNGTILEVTGRDLPPNYGYTCVKGRFGWEFYKSSERLTKPMIRESLEEDFREVSWDTALEFVAEGLRRVYEIYGPSAMGFMCSARVSNEENYLMQKLARSIFKTNNVDCPARV